MKFKDEDNTEKTGKVAEGDYHQDEDYQVWRKQKNSTFSNKLFKRIEIPLFFVGVGLAVIIILFVASISKTKKPAFDTEFKAIEKRLAQIEDRLNSLEAGIDGLGQLQDELQQVKSSLSRKMNQISAEVGKIKKITAGLKSAKSTASPPPKAVQTDTRKRVHQVGAGETFYSISRKYGIKVEELLSLNKLSADAVIHPGQELVVGP